MSFFEELAVIADALDKAGFYKEAGELDEEMKKKWEEMANLPAQNMAGKDLGSQETLAHLKRSLEAMMTAGNLGVPEDVMDKVYKAIDLVAIELHNKKELSPYMERLQQAKRVHYVPPEAVNIAEGFASLYNDILKMDEQLEGMSEDNPEYMTLRRDRDADEAKLKQLSTIMHNKLTPEQQKMVMDYVNSRVSEPRTNDVVLVPERRERTDRRRGE